MKEKPVGPALNIRLDKKPGFRNWWLRKKLPKEDRLLLYVIWSISKNRIDYTRFRCELFFLNKRLLGKGIDCKLPYYWGVLGVYPEWNEIKNRVNKWGYDFSIKVNGQHQSKWFEWKEE